MDIKKCPDKSIKKYGECIYPWYGLGPHIHNLKKTGSIIGSTEMLSEKDFPDGFCPDIEDNKYTGMGVYNCPHNEICKTT